MGSQPWYTKIGRANALKDKPVVTECCLVTVQDLKTGSYHKYVFGIFDVEVIQSEGLTTIILPFEFPKSYAGSVNFALAFTDDPWILDAAGFGSLGHCFLRFLLSGASFIIQGGTTVLQGNMLGYTRTVTVPDR